MKPLAEIAILLMLAIAFLQSSTDKMFDWKGNLEWLKPHFAKSPFKNMVAMNLFIIMVLELASGITSAIGAVVMFITGDAFFAMVGAILSTITFLALFLGQRLAKDYTGAQTIVVYLMPTFFLLYLLVG